MDAATILAEALNKAAGPPRDAFLDDMCAGNAVLRAEVAELLEAHGAAGEFLKPNDDRALVATQFVSSPSEKAGDQIGPYRLLQQIGEGGFGVVYMAEQTEPVRRKVALKVIKPGMDTKEVVSRFEAERQALALMEHPNIAKVLDGGTTQSGRPYFVMELVKGIPVTRFCDENRLDAPSRLRLFISICRAIHHAHQKGVIHRDIKPGNVLVTLHDGEPVPKVIDFGVAKAISQQLTEKTMFTAFGQMIGTPQYMSPEQAEMSGLDVDTRSDIYSLGVLLYELLTGTTPLDPKRLRETAFHEMQKLIREAEPPKPSTRFTSLQEQSANIASNRNTAPDKLRRLLHGDLDWIVMRSLEKSRERRYDSANAVAQDVERFLNDEPVEACPPSLTYAFQKFARRHRATLTAATVVLVTLMLGASIAVWQAVRATDERNRAMASERRALANEQAVSSVIDFLVREIISQANPFVQQNRDLTITDLLREIANSPATRFPDDPRAEASVRHYIGVICHRAGMIDEAQANLSRALELRQQTLGNKHVDTARTKFALAYAMHDFRLRYRPLKEIGGSRHRRRELLADAIVVFEKELGPKDAETLHALALQAFGFAFHSRKFDEADALYQELHSRAPDGLKSNPDDPDPLDLLGSVYVLIHLDDIGRNADVDAEIERRYETARRDLPKLHPQRAFWTEWYGQSLYFQGKLEQAYPYLRQGCDLRAQVLGEDNYFTFLSRRALAAAHVRMGHADQGIEELETALDHVPEHASQSLNLSVLYLDRNQEGDRGKWLEVAQRMLKTYEYSDNVASINNVLETCLVVSAESEDEQRMQRRAIELSQRFRALDKEQVDDPALQDFALQRRRYTIALANYRDGNIDEATERLKSVTTGPLRLFRACGFALQALIAASENDFPSAEQRLADARAAESEAEDWEINHPQYFSWNRPISVKLLIREATTAIEQAKQQEVPPASDAQGSH